VKHSRSWARRGIGTNPALAAAAVRSLAFLFLVAACVFMLRWPFERSITYKSELARSWNQPSFEFSGLSYGIQPRNRRLVYPYSVIPGGVRSAAELREIAKADPVIAAHYSGFNYDRARIMPVDRARLVYVSYRKGGKIHWTSKQAMLHPGEMLLTDGKITARTRCGNQVSVLPQANTSREEPALAELERPDAFASGTERLFPESSTLLYLDPLLPVGPLYAGFPQPGTFVPLPVGGGVGPTNSSTGGTTPLAPPSTVPEPGTMVLMLSGAAAVYARYRRHQT
jgi:PEP-CTERM motif